MRWFILFVIFVVGLGASVFLYDRFAEPQATAKPSGVVPVISTPPQIPATRAETKLQTLFVPYWQLDGREIEFPEIAYAGSVAKRMVYFGVAVSEDGVQQAEQGYQSLSLFSDKVPAGVQKYMGVRMTDHDKNVAILNNADAQKTIVDEVVALARDKQFDGIVVDLELTPSLNDKLPAQINTFIESFYTAAYAKDLKLAITMYGDTFYRKRPYDIAYLSKVTDEIMIMAYDLHKASGEPGPNFPLRGRASFGYDMETMIADFAGIGAEKLTVIYGMYGYDWTVDEKKRPIRPAKSVTLAQIKKNFIDLCASINCVQTRDKDAHETEIDFVDKQAQYHIIWFEDQESTEEKTEFLNSKGISSIAFWAYGYF